MILHLSPDAPILARAGAATLLALHVGGAAVGIVSGWTSILARKGGRLHRWTGNVFFVAMAIMAAVGAGVAPFLPTAQWTNTTMGVFVLYLISTSWAAVMRKPGKIGRFEHVAVVMPLGLALMAVAAVGGLRLGSGSPAAIYAVGVVAALAGVCDLRMLGAGGLSGSARIARHLWRMNLALVIATASYFLGQPRFVPAPIRGTLAAALPVLLALGLLAYWMLRTRLPRSGGPVGVPAL